MTNVVATNARCGCGHSFDVVAIENLHVSRRPDLRADLLENRFNVFPCSACGRSVQHERLLAYTDWARWQWITVFPPWERAQLGQSVRFAKDSFHAVLETNCPPVVREWAPRFREYQRVVFGIPALREKIVLRDAGLDDRIVEVMKLILLRELVFHPDASLVVDGVTDEHFLCTFRAAPWHQPEGLRVPRARYTVLALRLPTARAAFPALWNDIFVDFHVAMLPRGEGAQRVP